MTDIKSLTVQELEAEMLRLGERKFRAKQIYSWLHGKLSESFDEMTDLSSALRERLKQEYALTNLEMMEVQTSKLDGTSKFLFRLPDGNLIESVLMKYKFGNSVCISSQAGCRMGCRFCASALGGLARSLTPSEMLEQVYRIQKWSGERVRGVVVMGSGEPLDNFDSLLRFIELLTCEGGLRISQRNVTVSTCGIAPRIRELADQHLQITLALSLHAPTQEKREGLMPIAKKYELSEVIGSCRYYFQETGRRVTFEYSLIDGVNDTDTDARELSDLLRGMNCHVNLIPVNPVRERDFAQSGRRKTQHFREMLEKRGVQATIRRELGRDIDGACGQLRAKHMKQGS